MVGVILGLEDSGGLRGFRVAGGPQEVTERVGQLTCSRIQSLGSSTEAPLAILPIPQGTASFRNETSPGVSEILKMKGPGEE